MSDVLTPSQRSYCMSRIRGRDTAPEVRFRKELWALGVRYRIKNRLPGRPDLVVPAARVAIFIDGCFWHGCRSHFVLPKARRDFWMEKIEINRARDRQVTGELRRSGWKVVRIWEHDIEEDAPRSCGYVLRVISALR